MIRFLILAIITLLLIAGVGLGVLLVQKSQTINSEASYTEPILITGNSVKTVGGLKQASSQEVKVKLGLLNPPTSGIPTKYKISNTKIGLTFAQEEQFLRDGMQLDWKLSNGDGQKKVYVQYFINGSWVEPLTTLVTLKTDESSQLPDFGMHIDVANQEIFPTKAQFEALKPAWVRFTVPCSTGGTGCVFDSSILNQIPPDVKRIAVVTHETIGSKPEDSEPSSWKEYIDKEYIPALRNIIKEFGTKLSAIQIWNEPDNDTASSYIPSGAYAYLVNVSAGLIRSMDREMDIVLGGLALHDVQYLLNMQSRGTAVFNNLDPLEVFSDIDVLAFNEISTPTTILDTIPDVKGFLETSLLYGFNKPIWITELGIKDYTSPAYPRNQSQFAEYILNQMDTLSPIPEVVIWYAYSDAQTRDNKSDTFGLVNVKGDLKATGTSFYKFSSKKLASPPPLEAQASTPSASIKPTATPAAIVAPIIASPLPSKAPSPSPSPSVDKVFDLNKDGILDSKDVVYYQDELENNGPISQLDLNKDGKVNNFDLSLLRSKIVR